MLQEVSSLLSAWIGPYLNGGPLLNWDALHPTVVPLLIFVFRSLDLTLSTIRMLLTVRGLRPLAWIVAFSQALVFMLGVAGVLDNLDQPLNLLAYAAGFASGTALAMMIESRLAPGHSLIRVMSTGRGSQIIDAMRAQGFGATELAGRGLTGAVSLILINLPRRKVRQTQFEIIHLDPQAFITVEHVRAISGGWQA